MERRDAEEAHTEVWEVWAAGTGGRYTGLGGGRKEGNGG